VSETLYQDFWHKEWSLQWLQNKQCHSIYCYLILDKYSDVLLSIMLLTHYFPRCSARVLVHSYIFIFASSLQTRVTIHIPCRTMWSMLKYQGVWLIKLLKSRLTKSMTYAVSRFFRPDRCTDLSMEILWYNLWSILRWCCQRSSNHIPFLRIQAFIFQTNWGSHGSNWKFHR
jgi:hypothetical protein